MADAKSRSEKSIEEIYQKKTPLEHILCRPDTYVGSIDEQHERMWVFDRKAKKMTFKEIAFVPGLYKIFDEILVNAADNFVRDPVNMDKIEVWINQEEGWIKILNNGQGIPVQMHKEHQVHVPTLLFGELLTSDNYDDTEKKVTGGRNGYGAKLTNIFSRKFILETADSKTGLRFKQTWENNMSVKGAPEIEPFSGKDYTVVTFWPDLSRFHMEKLDDDIVDFMTKRVYDIAGTSQRGTSEGIKVFLNDERIKNLAGTKVKNFGDYVGLYLRSNDLKIHEVANDRWEYCLSISDGQFNQVSFCNSICTTKGGTHVTHVADQVIAAILQKVNSKNKGGMEVKSHHVKSHLHVFVNCLIENPAFDSQTKDTLTTKQGKFGSRCEVSEESIQRVLKSGLVEIILHWAKAKQDLDLKRKLKGSQTVQTRCLGIPKLEDANDAGTKEGKNCTLILTEGDSAKSLAVAGLSVVGRNRYGVFPLKGKLLNVRDASFKQIVENKEITNLLKILGLDQKKKYANGPDECVRYGSIMIMADQDLDGSHIKGLLVNLFQAWWPKLFAHDGFLKVFSTPIVKVAKSGLTHQFFTLQQYHTWEQANNTKGWKTKYYKGLGTSTSAEAKDYFKKMKKHMIKFEYTGDKCDEAIDLAFNKKRTDDRKGWIANADDDDYVDFSAASVTYSDFVAKELVHFSKYDVHRSIPSMVDGFKPTQRKVLFAAFKRKLASDVKVAQLVGYTSEQTSYHHGEASLESTIVGMAQDFVGSNNINLLFPSGQFGTRSMGGKDSASSRYIYTRLSKVTRTIFHPHDDAVLKYLDDEGMSIEPVHFVPVIPMILVNGGDGIGTGWSCSVPNYNPREIVSNLQRILRGQEVVPMHPWYAGFQGEISQVGKGYELAGKVEKTDEFTIEVTELPIRVWTQDYKEWLQSMLPLDQQPKDDAKEKKEGEEGAAPPPPTETPLVIDDIREYHTENTVHFVITLDAKNMARAEEEGLEKSFRIRKPGAATTNMVLFDGEKRVTKYCLPEEIMYDFAAVRIAFYQKRKTHMLEKLLREKATLEQKTRFILMLLDNKIRLHGRKKKDLVSDLRQEKFPTLQQIQKMTLDEEVAEEAEEEEAEDGEEGEGSGSGFNYLLGMPLWSLTFEKVEAMKKQLAEKAAEYEDLAKKSPELLWWVDLAAVERSLDDLDAAREKVASKSAKLVAKSRMAMKDEHERREARRLKEEARKDFFARGLASTKKVRAMDDEEDEDEVQDEEMAPAAVAAGHATPAKPSTQMEVDVPVETAVEEKEEEEQSDAESEEEEEEKEKSKKVEAPPAAPVPELVTFVPRERPIHEFTYKSKLKAKDEPKKRDRKPIESAVAGIEKAKPLGPNGESQADLRARRMAERAERAAEAAAEAEAKAAARKAAKEKAAAEAADGENVVPNQQAGPKTEMPALAASPELAADAALAEKLARAPLKRASDPVPPALLEAPQEKKFKGLR